RCSNECVVLVGEPAPSAWPDLGGLRSRVDDVGEQNGRQCDITFGSLAATGEELLDLVDQRVTVAGEEQMIVARYSNELCSVDVLGEIAARADMDVAVPLSMKNQGRNANGGQQGPYVSLEGRLENLRLFVTAQAQPSVPCPPLTESLISTATGSDDVDDCV